MGGLPGQRRGVRRGHETAFCALNCIQTPKDTFILEVMRRSAAAGSRDKGSRRRRLIITIIIITSSVQLPQETHHPEEQGILGVQSKDIVDHPAVKRREGENNYP